MPERDSGLPRARAGVWVHTDDLAVALAANDARTKGLVADLIKAEAITPGYVALGAVKKAILADAGASQTPGGQWLRGLVGNGTVDSAAKSIGEKVDLVELRKDVNALPGAVTNRIQRAVLSQVVADLSTTSSNGFATVGRIKQALRAMNQQTESRPERANAIRELLNGGFESLTAQAAEFRRERNASQGQQADRSAKSEPVSTPTTPTSHVDEALRRLPEGVFHDAAYIAYASVVPEAQWGTAIGGFEAVGAGIAATQSGPNSGVRNGPIFDAFKATGTLQATPDGDVGAVWGSAAITRSVTKVVEKRTAWGIKKGVAGQPMSSACRANEVIDGSHSDEPSIIVAVAGQPASNYVQKYGVNALSDPGGRPGVVIAAVVLPLSQATRLQKALTEDPSRAYDLLEVAGKRGTPGNHWDEGIPGIMNPIRKHLSELRNDSDCNAVVRSSRAPGRQPSAAFDYQRVSSARSPDTGRSTP